MSAFILYWSLQVFVESTTDFEVSRQQIEVLSEKLKFCFWQALLLLLTFSIEFTLLNFSIN